MKQLFTFAGVIFQASLLLYLHYLEINPLTGKPFHEDLSRKIRDLNNLQSGRDISGSSLPLGQEIDPETGEIIDSDSQASSKPHVIKLQAGETFDYSGEYRIIRFYKHLGVPSNWTFHDVTIATQCSINHMHHIVHLTNRWTGHLSVAVFAPGIDASYADDAIETIRRCYPKVVNQVDFHIVYPATSPGDFSYIGGKWSTMDCSEVLSAIENYGYQNYAVGDIPFPHNVLRNAARTGVTTEFVFLIDIDLTPSVNLRENFMKFAHREKLIGKSPAKGSNQAGPSAEMSIALEHEDTDVELVVWVVPVFEAKKDAQIPTDKEDLLNGVKNNIVRPFHNETCWWCHAPEDFNQWRSLAPSVHLSVGFEAIWDKSWEPFYISRREVPLFDERFKQYGFDRIQQICELYVAGYKFEILDNAFLAHDGWKIPKKFYKNKEADTVQNWVLFNYHFKDELQRKYQTTRTCSPVEPWLPDKLRKMGKKALKGPGQGEIPRVPSISDTLTKFSRALHDQSKIRDKTKIDVDSLIRKKSVLGNVHHFDHNSLGGDTDEYSNQEDYNNDDDENYKNSNGEDDDSYTDGFRIVEEESEKAVKEMEHRRGSSNLNSNSNTDNSDVFKVPESQIEVKEEDPNALSWE